MKKIIECYLVIIIIVATVLTCCKKEKEEVPVISTTAVSNITATSATSGGNITNEGSSTVITRGVCWSTGTTPIIADNKTQDGTGAGSFSSSIIGLNGVTIYYVRAYATNGAGIGYGMAMSFTTLGQSPTPTVAEATNINATTATLNGTVNANYLSTVVTFEYGTTTGYGSTVTATQSPATGNTVTNISADIVALTAGTVYHYRVKAVNSLGTTYSTDLTFTTLGQVPTVSTLAATNITLVAAQLNGTVNANYLSSTVTFEYGTATGYGITATATQSPITGNTNTNVSASITGLSVGTTYHYRVKAINSLGITNGSDMMFTTAPANVNDIDGNTYNVVAIGAQVWMKENLKTTKYNDGTAIPNMTDYIAWVALTTGAYCDYNNTPSNSTTYGKLYNYYSVVDARKLCPTGWHVPTDVEWTTLENYLIANGYNWDGTTTGNKIGKSMASTSGWTTNPTAGNIGNDQASNNSSGFTALPSGYRYDYGITFFYLGGLGFLWSSTEYSTTTALNRSMGYYHTDVTSSSTPKENGCSVRCLRDF